MFIGLPGRHRRLEKGDHAAEEGSEGGRSGGVVAVAGDAPVIHCRLHDQNLLGGVGVSGVAALVLLMESV